MKNVLDYPGLYEVAYFFILNIKFNSSIVEPKNTSIKEQKRLSTDFKALWNGQSVSSHRRADVLRKTFSVLGIFVSRFQYTRLTVSIKSNINHKLNWKACPTGLYAKINVFYHFSNAFTRVFLRRQKKTWVLIEIYAFNYISFTKQSVGREASPAGDWPILTPPRTGYLHFTTTTWPAGETSYFRTNCLYVSANFPRGSDVSQSQAKQSWTLREEMHAVVPGRPFQSFRALLSVDWHFWAT